jgi:hypothetical protein
MKNEYISIIINIFIVFFLVSCDNNSGLDNAPATPQLIAPEDESVFDHYPRSTTLEWSLVEGKQPIEFVLQRQYSWDGDYENFGSWEEGGFGRYSDLTQTENTYEFDFVGAQPGRWRVKAVNNHGDSDWSDWSYFRYTR